MSEPPADSAIANEKTRGVETRQKARKDCDSSGYDVGALGLESGHPAALCHGELEVLGQLAFDHLTRQYQAVHSFGVILAKFQLDTGNTRGSSGSSH